MRILKLISLSFLAKVIFSASVCYACTCVSFSFKEEVKQSKVVFSGEVFSVEYVLNHRVITFNVIDGWKGVDKSQLIVVTEALGEACGYEFLDAKKYLVFADLNPEDNQLYVSSCSRTKRIDDAVEDIKKLGQPKIRIIRK